MLVEKPPQECRWWLQITYSRPLHEEKSAAHRTSRIDCKDEEALRKCNENDEDYDNQYPGAPHEFSGAREKGKQSNNDRPADEKKSTRTEEPRHATDSLELPLDGPLTRSACPIQMHKIGKIHESMARKPMAVILCAK